MSSDSTPLPAPARPPGPPSGAATAVAAASSPGRRFRLDPRYIAPFLVTSIVVAANLSYQNLEGLDKTLLAIVAAILADAVLGRIFYGKVPHLASAYITGISVGILIRSPYVWPYALCSLISITSKYVLRVKGRHIWNPSNFGIVMMVFLYFKDVATLSIQWDNSHFPMLVIWALGSFIISRLKRFHICLTYALCFIALSGLRAAITGQEFWGEVAPITGPMYQLFIFFMITDPKTTVQSKSGQIMVAAMIAVAEFVLRVGGHFLPYQGWSHVFAHAPYLALFAVGPIANLMEIRKQSRKEATDATRG